MQVLSLTQEQINSLPPTERDQIQQLVCQTPHVLRKTADYFLGLGNRGNNLALPSECSYRC